MQKCCTRNMEQETNKSNKQSEQSMEDVATGGKNQTSSMKHMTSMIVTAYYASNHTSSGANII